MKISEESLLKIKNQLGENNIKEKEPMKQHSTMKVGGCAAMFLTPEKEEDAALLLKIFNEENVPYYILGNGSNVIVRDEGFDGAVICFLDNFTGIELKDNEDGTVQVKVKSGTLNKDLSAFLAENSITGFEFASGIPGTVGGATAMNAGAYDGEIKNIVESVKLMDKAGNIAIKTNLEMDFGYRHSLVSSGDYVVLETTFLLKKGDRKAIQERIDDLTQRREEKQPLEYPSCGSTFKRPEGYFAGKLISDAGLKGYVLGGAQVSEKHAGFIINRYDGTAADVLNLIEYVKEKVYETQGVKLECEVKIL